VRQLLIHSMAAAALGTVLPASHADTRTGCRLSGIPVPGFAETALAPEAFRALHAAVAPRGQGERWTAIPWQTDLKAVRRQAAREGKPLLMWVMDGHPLGCT
jgi:hypothetical protein